MSKITGKPEGPNSGWVHVSYNSVGENRKEVLRTVKNPKSKKVEYFPGLTDSYPKRQVFALLSPARPTSQRKTFQTPTAQIERKNFSLL